MITTIEWTERTWNPLRGCSRVSEGCRNCYAERIAARFSQPGNTFHGFAERTPDGPRWTGDVVLLKDRLGEPFTWKKPARVFVNSMSDLFHENLPDDAIDQVFAVMALAPQHTFQVLTKRAARMREYFAYEYRWAQIEGACDDMVGMQNAPALATPERRSLPHVWLGVSVENQATADERIPLLLQTPAAIRFISAEPLLERINLAGRLNGRASGTVGLDWVICGGESGAGARPFDAAWARAIVAQCRSARVPVFVKQLGACVLDRNDAGFEGDTHTAWPMDTAVEDHPNGYREEYQGAPVRVRLLDRKGSDMAEWPRDIRVRELPEARG